MILFSFIFYGLLGCFAEGVYNSIFTRPHNYKINDIMNSPKGRFIFVSAYMFIIYGLGGLVSYLICLKPHLWYYFPILIIDIWVILVLIEFVSGIILNKIFKLNIWSYDNEKHNILGVVSLRSVLLMLAMSVFLYFNNLFFGAIM